MLHFATQNTDTIVFTFCFAKCKDNCLVKMGALQKFVMSTFCLNILLNIFASVNLHTSGRDWHQARITLYLQFIKCYIVYKKCLFCSHFNFIKKQVHPILVSFVLHFLLNKIKSNFI